MTVLALILIEKLGMGEVSLMNCRNDQLPKIQLFKGFSRLWEVGRNIPVMGSCFIWGNGRGGK